MTPGPGVAAFIRMPALHQGPGIPHRRPKSAAGYFDAVVASISGSPPSTVLTFSTRARFFFALA